jgi:hypothetical protein
LLLIKAAHACKAVCSLLSGATPNSIVQGCRNGGLSLIKDDDAIGCPVTRSTCQCATSLEALLDSGHSEGLDGEDNDDPDIDGVSHEIVDQLFAAEEDLLLVDIVRVSCVHGLNKVRLIPSMSNPLTAGLNRSSGHLSRSFAMINWLPLGKVQLTGRSVVVAAFCFSAS